MWICKNRDPCTLAEVNHRTIHILRSGVKKSLVILFLYPYPHILCQYTKRTYYSKMLNCFIWIFNGKICRSPSFLNKHKYVVKLENRALFFFLPSACVQRWHNLAGDRSLCHHGNACNDVAKYLSNSVPCGF